MSDAAKERYIALRAAWQALGQEVEAIRAELGVEVCPRCRGVVREGFHHQMFNGNQMFACVEVAGPASQLPGSMQWTTSDPVPRYFPPSPDPSNH